MGVTTLFENEDYLIVNKPFDMYINSEDENEKVCFNYALIILFNATKTTYCRLCCDT